MQDPERRASIRASHRAFERRLRPPKPTPEEQETAKRKRALEYDRRLIDDPEFRERETAKGVARDRAKRARRRQRMQADPAYRRRMQDKKNAARRRKWATDPAYRAKRQEKERGRRARRRAETEETCQTEP